MFVHVELFGDDCHWYSIVPEPPVGKVILAMFAGLNAPHAVSFEPIVPPPVKLLHCAEDKIAVHVNAIIAHTVNNNFDFMLALFRVGLKSENKYKTILCFFVKMYKPAVNNLSRKVKTGNS